MSNFLNGKRELANLAARRKTRKQLADELYRNPGTETCTRKSSKVCAKKIIALALRKAKSQAKVEAKIGGAE